MADHQNVQMLRDAYAAFARGDVDAVRATWTDDVVWHVGGNSPLAGDFKGADEIMAFFGRIGEVSGGTFQIELHDVLANDEHAVALARITGKRDGKSLDTNVVHIFHVRGGKVSEFWSFNEDDRLVDEFWS